RPPQSPPFPYTTLFRSQLLVGHLEAAVAVDGPDRGSGHADLGAHRGRDGVAHGAEAAGVEPGVGLLVADELRGPHLVLAHARGRSEEHTSELQSRENLV